MAIDFPGVDEYINCGSGATLDDLAAKTIAFWLNVDTLDANYHIYMEKYAAGTGQLWGVMSNDNYPAAGNSDDTLIYVQGFNVANGAWRMPEGILTVGTWYHIAMSHSDRTSTAVDPMMYLNGVSQSVTELAAPNGATAADAAASFVIGARDGGSIPADGRMEDVRLFNRVITAQEAAILASGYRGPMGGEVGWWAMDGAQAITHFDAANLAVNTNYIPDLSGNANTGNPTGTPIGAASACPRVGGITD